ncbi:MAG: PQQ-binding-like beta-propeller repeat protein [Gemmataceae bacterium]
MRIILALLAGGFGMVIASTGDKENWLYMRGNPAQTGYVQDKLPEKLSIIWSFQAGDAFESGVAIDRGMVFAGSMDENLYGLDAASGKLKWKQKVAPFKASPAIHDHNVYVGDLDGKFHCFECSSGKKKWSFETGAEAGGANFFSNTVLFTSHDEHLYSLELSGKENVNEF